HTFIKGNPSSHKGWMSRFFNIKRDGKRNPWKCKMSWRDNVYTLTPRTPDRSPNLTSFLEAMHEACMDKAEMLQFLEETEEAAAPPKKVAKKRKASTLAEKEARRQRKKWIFLVGSQFPAYVSILTFEFLCKRWLGGAGDKTPHPSSASGKRDLLAFRRGDGIPHRAGSAARGAEAIRDQEKKTAEAVKEALRAQLATEQELREVMASAELSLSAQVGLPPEEVPVRNWA
ncbi:hypothetical protein F511_08656, partial [Dorcoceras hygrometricum]